MLKRIISILLIFAFLFTQVGFSPEANAQEAMFSLGSNYTPAIVSGIILYPDNPLKFDFIIDIGDDQLNGKDLRNESQKLINYFMATLTVPENEMWVNLSPNEPDRIIADGLGNTILGRDLLSQDYLLKQITASLMHPEGEIGSEFWNRVYEKAEEKFGTLDISADSFSKVWIVPEQAQIYISGTNVFVADSKLKVLMEEEYSKTVGDAGLRATKKIENKRSSDLRTMQNDNDSSQIIREIIIPEIEREVNEGKHFANLRQMYNSVILATWYKHNLKKSILGKVYADQNKVDGLEYAGERLDPFRNENDININGSPQGTSLQNISAKFNRLPLRQMRSNKPYSINFPS